MTHVVHFADLEEMIIELDPFEKVRVGSFKTIEGQDEKGVVYEVIGVHVRQIQGDRILSWMFPASRYRMSGGDPLEETDRVNMISGWEMADHVKQLVEDHLLHTDTFKIRAGVIDLGNKIPLPGYWSALNDDKLAEIIKDIENKQEKEGDK